MDFSLSKQQEMFRQEMQRFCKKELSHEYVLWMDDNVDFVPDELWKKFADLGMFSAGIPEQYGGDGLPMTDLMIGFEEICKASLSVANAVGATIGFGTRFIAELGSEAQKADLLPRLGRGELKMCMALTEPAGGTDILGSISTTAEEKGGSWVLSGQKIFITGAHVADYMIVIAKTDPNEKPSRSLSVFLVPGKSKGIRIGRVPKISFHHCDSVEVFFDNVEMVARMQNRASARV